MAGSILIRQLLGYGALCMLVSCASVQPQQSEQSEQPQQSELSEQQKLIPDVENNSLSSELCTVSGI